MNCITKDNKGAEFILDYCAGTADSEQAARIEAHLRECAECRERVEAQRSLWQTLDAWKPIEVSPDFDARLYARVAQQQSTPWWRWKPALPLAAIAAALTLIVVVRTAPPVAPPAPAQHQAQKIDIQEVQQALDDLDLLSPAASPL